jgi:3-hydroxyacyl-[acyl-carrier-protein] dehydratase
MNLALTLANEVYLLESQWSLLKEVKVTNNNHIEAFADVPADSPWFSGHFPGKPILPGIALIHLVKQAIIQEALKKGEQLQLHVLKRVRFIQPVWPGETLSVSIKVEDTDEDALFFFRVIKQENVVCSGFIAAKKIKSKNK